MVQPKVNSFSLSSYVWAARNFCQVLGQDIFYFIICWKNLVKCNERFQVHFATGNPLVDKQSSTVSGQNRVHRQKNKKQLISS